MCSGIKKSKPYSAFVNLIGLFEGLSIFTGDIFNSVTEIQTVFKVQVLQINHFNDPKLILLCQFNK